MKKKSVGKINKAPIQAQISYIGRHNITIN